MADIIDKAQALGVLQGFNPWWMGQVCSVPPFRRLAYGTCRKYLDDKSLRRAVLLSGPRRVGKTTILLQIAQGLIAQGRAPGSIFYVSLDHPLLKFLSLAGILQIYHENVHAEGQDATLLLDEVQYASDWELHLKQFIDHKPEYRILATGSASLSHDEALADSGVGRWIKVPIPTLSFYEFLHIRKETPPNVSGDLRPRELFEKSPGELSALAAACRGLMPLFRRYLLVGGFPETACRSDIMLCQRLLREDVVERVLKRDMTALFGTRNVNELEKMFVYICIHSGEILAVKTCASALETSATTVSHHLRRLEQANLIYRLPPIATGGKKILRARDKVYLVDAALRNAVLLRGEEVLSNPSEMGNIVETAVLRHLYAYHYPDLPRIAYWRDSSTQKEVDIIVKSPAYLIPVEVKYRENASLGPKDGIVEFCRQEDATLAYFITQRDRDFDVVTFEGVKNRFLRIPAHIFTYLLGQAERLLWTE